MQQPVYGQTTHAELRARQQKRFHADNKEAQAHRKADFERRTRAAGIDREPDDENIDAFRYRLARILTMFRNDWEGCPLRLCRRMQGCMAPQSTCANHTDDPPMTQEEWQARWEVARLKWRRALDERIEAAGGREAWESLAERERDQSHKKS